jgi:hypothetical protein
LPLIESLNSRQPFSERVPHLWQPLGTEDEQRDDQDDDQLKRADVWHGSPPLRG